LFSSTWMNVFCFFDASKKEQLWQEYCIFFPRTGRLSLTSLFYGFCICHRSEYSSLFPRDPCHYGAWLLFAKAFQSQTGLLAKAFSLSVSNFIFSTPQSPSEPCSHC
jgi:hypothetical protein